MKHTPGPWTLLKDLAKNGEWSYLIGPAGYKIAGNASDTGKANAERIVLCVNTHDELLEALEDAVPILEREADDEPGKAFLKFVKATIAKARGES